MIFVTGLLLWVVLVIVFRLFNIGRLPDFHWARITVTILTFISLILMALSVITLLARVMP